MKKKKLKKNSAKRTTKRPVKRTTKRTTKRPVKRTTKRAMKRPAKRTTKRNARPSVVKMLLPIEDINLIAAGAVNDLKDVAKAARGKRNGRVPVRTGVKASKGRGSRKNPYCHRVARRNGEQAGAARLYEEFHGRESSQTLAFAQETKTRDWLGGLGTLVELQYLTPTNYEAATAFEGDSAPELACSADGRSLYIVGGSQSVDLAAVEMDGPEWRKDLMVLGLLTQLTYSTQKRFHAFEFVNYFHDLGEETGVVPLLVFDALNERLLIVGGQYQVRPEGIVN